MSLRLLAVLVAGLAALSSSAPALAAPANVTVRVEGASATLVPRTAVKTTPAPVNKDGVTGHQCTGTSAAGALEQATGGAWNGAWNDAFGYGVATIKGETYDFSTPDFFTLWINDTSAGEGVCGVTSELQEGDEVLFFVDRYVADPVTYERTNPPILPLGLKNVPGTVTPGVPFNVTVVEYGYDGTQAPAAGATVTGGDAAVTADGAGVATVTVTAAGAASLRATKADRARSASESVCATNGADGACGSNLVGHGVQPGVPCPTNGRDGLCGTIDHTAPAATLSGIRNGARFARGKGPRRLKATVASDPSGLRIVKLRLTRTDGPRCEYFSGRSERFRRKPCGESNFAWFGVGDRENVDYLLPRALPRGRYVLDAKAVDKAFNRDDARVRPRNRVVFHVS